MISPAIILVSPQMGENIGAVARAMKNFGLSDLRVVNPRDGWPNTAAEAMAVGAIDLIHQAQVFDYLSDAIKDIEYIYATTAASRNINKDQIKASKISSATLTDKKIAILFGRENNGLTNQEISIANKIITIETTEFSSLNIAHAVAVVAHQFFLTSHQQPNIQKQDIIPCTKGELDYFLKKLITHLDQKDFFHIPEKRELMIMNLNNLFYRIENFSKTEIQLLHGIFNVLK